MASRMSSRRGCSQPDSEPATDRERHTEREVEAAEGKAWRRSKSEMNQTAFRRDHDHFGAVARVQLSENRTDMEFDHALGDGQCF